MLLIEKEVTREVFGTKEWAEHNENIIDGCVHDCKYCYSKEMAIRFKRKTSQNWAHEELRKDYLTKIVSLKSGRVMFPSSHDIHPIHLEQTIYFLEKLLRIGNKVLIVTKPHLICIQSICSELANYRNQILFRFTIGSDNDSILSFWEPNAPCFDERFASLEYAFKMGFETSVSSEPMLDSNIAKLISKLRLMVTNSIWIGKANLLHHRLKLNGFHDPLTLAKATELISNLSDEYIISLYYEFKDDPLIKWKESVKKIVGIKLPTAAGLDI